MALTSTQILAAVSDALVSNNYAEVTTPGNRIGSARVFEDAFGVVAVNVYETWTQLSQKWHIAQGEFVDLISDHMRRGEPKAWEGYLVLLTPGLVGEDEMLEITEIRNDTSRVRKIVASGDGLTTLEDVQSALLPLLPLPVNESVSAADSNLLALLPDLLESSGIQPRLTRAALDAFASNESILERLHSVRTAQ
jgi:hypothetical protein